MPIQITCEICGTDFSVIPARKNSAKFCSLKCRNKWQSINKSGENHPLWQGGEREKKCKHCGVTFTQTPTEAISTFRSRKFCSKPCADVGGLRYHGKDNVRWKGGRKGRPSKHYKWASAVIARDNGVCQNCGISGVEIHAHHILGYKENKTDRFDVSNGISLCAKCHWDTHTAAIANGVNSVEALTDSAEGNTEPSHNGNVMEGVTTRGRAFRRIINPCDTCGKPVSRTFGEMRKNKTGLVYCSKECMGKAHSKYFSHGSNSSKSALPERDDIV